MGGADRRDCDCLIGCRALRSFNGTTLARRHGLMVVSINYRLGSLGFLPLARPPCPPRRRRVPCGVGRSRLPAGWRRERVSVE